MSLPFWELLTAPSLPANGTERIPAFLPWRTVDMCRYHGEVWNRKTGGKCRAHAQRCSCSLWGLLYNLFFYLEYQLFNPEQNWICAWLFLCSIPVPVLVSGEGDSPGNFWPCSDHVWVWKLSRAGLCHWEDGVLPSFMGKQPLTSICSVLLAGLQDTVLWGPWRTLPLCLGRLKDSSWPWKSQEWGMPRDAGYSVSSGVCRCFCTTKPVLMQCFCQVSCCRVSAITCCFLLLIFASPYHYTFLYLFSHLLFCFVFKCSQGWGEDA